MKKLNDKLFSWASIIEPNTEGQAINTASLPFVSPHLALMPDAHLGAGATVGSVIPTEGAIIPAAVGVDIGCGMIAVKTQYKQSDITGDLAQLRHSIERSIPLNAGSYNQKLTETAKPRVEELARLAGDRRAVYDNLTKTHWSLQLGSLGSGNHFCEVCVDEEGSVWLFLHSGSRGIGNQIARYHINEAKRYVKRPFIQKSFGKLPDPDLAFLIEGTAEFDLYIRDLVWAQRFALLNREEMMDRVVKDFGYFMGGEGASAVQQLERINCHHNFTEREYHFGREIWISRKGAISAKKGQKGLIPGSMGTASYVVRGKGNPMAFCSSPHGAGRMYSRTEARKTFTHEQLREAMKGIEFRDTDAFLDEHPLAYKDIDVVMQDAGDLVEIEHTFRQIVNVKGD